MVESPVGKQKAKPISDSIVSVLLSIGIYE